MKSLLFLLLPCILSAQGILQPAGDSTLTNILVGSAVTLQGQVNYTKDIYLAKSDGSAPVRLTNFDPTNTTPGATWVAISPDGTRGAYLAVLNSGGVRSEEVHALDPVTGADRRIAVNMTSCGQQPCLYELSFSQDGSKLVWENSGQIFVADYDGSAVQQLVTGDLSATPSVTSADGRVTFSEVLGVQTIQLDGSGLTTVAHSAGMDEFVEGNISADGSTIALQLCDVAMTGPQPGCRLGAGDTQFDTEIEGYEFSGVSLSSNGSTAAWIYYPDSVLGWSGALRAAQAGTRVSTLTDPSLNSAFDVAVSADGSKLLYSIGLGKVRGAVWVSDINGQNARPVFAPRSISIGGITGLSSAATTQLLSPGSYFTIYGTNFESGTATVTAASLPLLSTLAGLTVTVNGAPVPLQAVTPWQINALLPQSAQTGVAILTVQFSDGSALSATPTVAPTAPALITYVNYYATYAAVFHGSTANLVTPQSPAQKGEVLASYGFGLGATNPLVAGGNAAPFSPLAQTVAAPQLTVDGQPATILYSGLVPGLAGLYQINFIVPSGLASGAHSVQWQTKDSTNGPAGAMYVQ